MHENANLRHHLVESKALLECLVLQPRITSIKVSLFTLLLETHLLVLCTGWRIYSGGRSGGKGFPDAVTGVSSAAFLYQTRLLCACIAVIFSSLMVSKCADCYCDL